MHLERGTVDHGVTINSVSIGTQAGADYLLLDSGAQLHACIITYPGQKILLPDPGIHTASSARLQHDGGRPTNNSSAFPLLCSSETNSVSGLSCSAGDWVIFVQTLVHCSFLTRSRRNTAKHSCTRKRLCSLSKERWLRACRQLV